MKKILTLFLVMFLLVGCETQQERDERIKNENKNKLNEEYKDYEVSDNVKNWLVNTKLEPVVTILCLSTSKKCNQISEYYKEVIKENNIYIEYVELDKVSDNDRKIYKTTFDISNYSSYVPYIFITNKSKLVNAVTDVYKKEDLIKYFIENNLITEK